MKAVFFILLLSLLASYNSFGQVKPNIFLEGGINYTLIPDDESTVNYSPLIPSTTYFTSYTSSSTIIDDYDSKPGFDFSVGLNAIVSKKFELETGIGISILSFRLSNEVKINYPSGSNSSFQELLNKRRFLINDSASTIGGWRFSDINSENPTPPVNSNVDQDKTELTYINLPLTVNYHIIENKLKIGASYSTNILVHVHDVKNRLQYAYSQNGIFAFEEVKEVSSSKAPYTQVLFNLNVSLKYNFFKQLWVTSSFTQGLTSIHNPNTGLGVRSYEAKNRMVNLGLRYEIGL